MGKPLAERPLQTPEEFAYHLSERYGFIAFEMQAVIADIAARDAEIAEEAAKRIEYRTRRGRVFSRDGLSHAYEALRNTLDDDPPSKETASKAGWQVRP